MMIIKVIETFRDKTKLNTVVLHLMLKLISRSPLWLGGKVVAFHQRGPCSIPDITLIYALFLNRPSNIIHSIPQYNPDEGSAQCQDTSETTRTWKTIHTIHAPIYSNKADMKGWLWRRNDIRGPCGHKASWHLSYSCGKTPKKPHPGNFSRPRIEPGPAEWQARMQPPAPQRWTQVISSIIILSYM